MVAAQPLKARSPKLSCSEQFPVTLHVRRTSCRIASRGVEDLNSRRSCSTAKIGHSSICDRVVKTFECIPVEKHVYVLR